MTREHAWRPYGSVEMLCPACGFVTGHAPNASQSEIEESIDWALREYNWSRDCSGRHHVRGKIIARKKRNPPHGTTT